MKKCYFYLLRESCQFTFKLFMDEIFKAERQKSSTDEGMVMKCLLKLTKLQHPGKDTHSFILWGLAKLLNHPAVESYRIASI